MKKLLLIGGVLVVALLALGVAGYAYAQSRVPAVSTMLYARSTMADWGPQGGMGGGRHHGGARGEGEYGPMHEYIFNAMAEAFDMTPEELEELHDSGKTMWDIAQERGLTEDEFAELMLAARAKALEQAVADGVITQEQADWMLEHMGQMWSAPGAEGQGYGPCHGGGFGGRGGGGGPGWRWNTQPGEEPAVPET